MDSKRVRPLFLLLLYIVTGNSFLLNDDEEYQVWLTTGDKSKLLERQSAIRASHGHYGYSVWVDRNKPRQTIDGFGAAITNSAAYVLYHSPQRHTVMRDLFGNSIDDLGVSYIRICIGASDMNAETPYTYDDLSNPHNTDFNMDHFTIDKDRQFVIPIIKEALSINPTLKIMASPWSAPAWMKKSHKLFGGDFNDDSKYMEAFAKYLVKFIQAYEAEGIPIDSFSVQNVPLLSRDDYPTMVMNADVMKTFIKQHLGPLMRQNNIHSKLLVWDFNWSGEWYPEALVSDADVKQYVSGVAWHGYDGRHDTPLDFHVKHTDLGTYFSEFSGGGWDDGVWSNRLVDDARLIFVGQVRSFSKNVILWNLALDEHQGPKKDVGGCSSCRPIVTVPSNGQNYTREVDYYAMAHLSKFVKTGAVRLESNWHYGWDEIHTAAFVNPDGTTVIVVLNPHTSNYADFSLDIDARHYQYMDLPPQSIVTFVK